MFSKVNNKRLLSLYQESDNSLFNLSELQDLNLRPLRPERSALPS